MSSHPICLLGGTGFVGHALAARLARRGERVKILTRRPERHRDLLVLPGLSLIEADIGDPESLRRELEGCGAAINLVGILNERGHDGRGFRSLHVDLPARVAEACRAAGVRRLLHMSALGASPGSASAYQRTKAEGEDLLHAASGLDVTSFRPSVIFGRGDSFFNRFAALLRRLPILPLACAQARLQPVWVGDVAEAFAQTIDRHATHGRRYELCGPRVYTLLQLVEYTAAALGLRRRIVDIGPEWSRRQARLMEYLPGKPFSWDNYLSLLTDNLCAGPFPPLFGIAPSAVEEIVPGYLRRERER